MLNPTNKMPGQAGHDGTERPPIRSGVTLKGTAAEFRNGDGGGDGGVKGFGAGVIDRERRDEEAVCHAGGSLGRNAVGLVADNYDSRDR